MWDVGREFGTIAMRRGEAHIEITTYRSDEYDPTSRKPQVRFGDTLDGDLSRRDFAINAMAVRLPSGEFVDNFGGARRPRGRGRPHPGGGRHLLRRRPAADDACGQVRRAARLHRPSGGRHGDDRDGRPARHRVRRAGPRRAGQAGVRGPARRRAAAAGRDRAGRAHAPRAARPRAGARRAPPAQGRLRALAHRPRAGHRAGGPAAATARTSSSGWPRCCTTSASPRPGASSPAAR